MNINIINELDNLKEYSVEMRRYFHQNPELSLKEFNTAKKIEEELSRLEIPFSYFSQTGIAGKIGNKGPLIALRADMDALALNEETGLSFSSANPGVSHACGHDGHMASLLTAAHILKAHENELNIRILLLFEPGEEVCRGARLALGSHMLDDVKYMFGLHIFTDIESGTVSVTKGPRMAITDKFRITVKGNGGHAGKPHQCVDAALTGAQILTSLQSIVSRSADPVHSVVVSAGKFTAGTAYNIIAEQAVIEGTVRSFSTEDSLMVKERLTCISENTAKACNAQAIVEYSASEHPAVINPDELTTNFKKEIQPKLPGITSKDLPPIMLGEDFSVYQEKIPAVFAFLGGRKGEETSYPNHHPKFNFDEDALLTGAALHILFAEYINNLI